MFLLFVTCLALVSMFCLHPVLLLVTLIILPLTSVAKLNAMSLYWYVPLSHMGSVSSVTTDGSVVCVRTGLIWLLLG